MVGEDPWWRGLTEPADVPNSVACLFFEPCCDDSLFTRFCSSQAMTVSNNVKKTLRLRRCRYSVLTLRSRTKEVGVVIAMLRQRKILIFERAAKSQKLEG